MNVHSVSLKGARPQNEDKHDIIININPKSDKYDATKNNINYLDKRPVALFDRMIPTRVNIILSNVNSR